MKCYEKSKLGQSGNNVSNFIKSTVDKKKLGNRILKYVLGFPPMS